MSLSCMGKEGLGPPISCILTLLPVSVLEQPAKVDAAARRINILTNFDIDFMFMVFILF